jgi:hypothetical protein
VIEQGSDTLILLLSVTSGRQARRLIRDIVEDPDSWNAWGEDLPKPEYLWVTGMYEIIGNWDLAVFIQAGTSVAEKLIARLRREILRQANLHASSPVHERGGQFGRFQGIVANFEKPSLDPEDSADFHRTTFENPQDYEEQGQTRSFIVVDTPDEEHTANPVPELLSRMHLAVAESSVAATVERVYSNSRQLVLELMSVRPGATDITRFNRLVEPILSEAAVLKYTLLCYEYDEVPFGWGPPPNPEKPGPTGRTR